jgi:hypothetical protein
LTLATFSAACLCNLSVPSLAQTSDRRAGSPNYLHVRSDLYKAETVMRAPAAPRVKREENAAVGFIAAAIRDVNAAAHLEDLNTVLSPPPNLLDGERLKEAEHSLDDAWSELSKPESDGRALPARASAVQNVRDAQNRVLRAEAIVAGQ